MKSQTMHCCSVMDTHLSRDEVAITYAPKFREYGILYRDGLSLQQIRYCPWCGKELPESLRDQWFDELDRRGLEPEGDLPKELTSDAWWRQPKE